MHDSWVMFYSTDSYRVEGHSDLTEEVSEGNIQVTDTKNGCFSSQSPLWNYTTHLCSMALLPHLQIEKHQKIAETAGSRQTSLVWNVNMQYCTEDYEKSFKKETLYKTACGRRWTVKSSDEALKLPLLFLCSHSLFTLTIFKCSCSTCLTWNCSE